MPEQWYYAEGDTQRGPVGPDAIKALIKQGRINADTLIWCEGEPVWKPARDFALYFPVTSPSAPIPAPVHRLPPPQPKPPQRATLVIAPQPKRRRLWLWIGGPVVGLLAVAVIVPQLLRSRLVANESAALMACLTYVTAQDICHLQDRDGDGTCEYATNLADLEQLGVIDMAMANAGGEPGHAIAGKAGYCFKVLMQQGDSGPEGPHDYRDDKGNMLSGHALVAYPVEWDSTGRHTFMVNHWGNVFRKDLGAETSRHVASMKAFAVDETWELVGSSYSDDMEAYRVRGLAMARAGQWRGAVEYLSKVVQANQATPEVLQALALAKSAWGSAAAARSTPFHSDRYNFFPSMNTAPTGDTIGDRTPVSLEVYQALALDLAQAGKGVEAMAVINEAKAKGIEVQLPTDLMLEIIRADNERLKAEYPARLAELQAQMINEVNRSINEGMSLERAIAFAGKGDPRNSQWLMTQFANHPAAAGGLRTMGKAPPVQFSRGGVPATGHGQPGGSTTMASRDAEIKTTQQKLDQVKQEYARKDSELQKNYAKAQDLRRDMKTASESRKRSLSSQHSDLAIDANRLKDDLKALDQKRRDLEAALTKLSRDPTNP